MSFLVSPGVEVNEIDRTDVVPALSNSIGGFAGDFNWGPYEQIVSVSNEKELGSIFSTPTRDKSIATSFLTAASFLKYGRSLRVVRTLNEGANTSRAINASVNEVSIFNFKDVESFETITDLPPTVWARYPGELGNSIQVKIAYSDLSISQYDATFKPHFDYKPLKTAYSTKLQSTANDEIHILVIDVDGQISGTRGAILEKYQGLSLAADAKGEDGSSIWYGDVVNRSSAYIYISGMTAIFPNADVILSDNPNIYITRKNGSNIREASVDVNMFAIVANTGYINGDEAVEINGGTTTLKKGVKIAIGFNNPIYTNMSGNGCRIILKSVTSTSDDDPVVSFDVKNSNKDSFDMDVKVEYTSDHTIFDIIHALNKSEDNLYTISGTVTARACEFSAYISEDYVIKTSNANTQGDPDSDTTSVRATNSISTPITTAQLNSSAYSHVKVLANLRPDYAWSVVNTLLTFAADVTNITGFSGAIADGGSLSELVLQLRGGINRSTALTATRSADIIKALEVIEYVDRDLLDINYLFAQQVDGIDVDNKIRDIVEARRDLIGFISAPTSVSSLSSNDEKKNAVLNKFSGIASSSFLVFDSTPLYVYNKYQDNYVWIPACGHMAGLCANTDLISEPWFSPAGFNRGQLRGVTKLALNPTQLERDDLYKNRINPIISFPGQGIVLFGDKTALSKASAFDRINVRKLFNIVERTVARYAKSQLFEINDEFTRNAFRASIEPFLRDVRGRRGISDYRVVCDETNNTPSVIDGNRFVGDIYIKPVKSINYISLNFIATRTGVSFTEIAG
jgi:phage tail sheath protein FI